jgi:hypothetical protein
MNAKAQQLNMTASHFSTADGYDDYNKYSTPEDLVIRGWKRFITASFWKRRMSRLIRSRRTKRRIRAIDRLLFIQTFDTSVFTDISGANVYYDARFTV